MSASTIPAPPPESSGDPERFAAIVKHLLDDALKLLVADVSLLRAALENLRDEIRPRLADHDLEIKAIKLTIVNLSRRLDAIEVVRDSV
jgi:CO dehydrogenase/acetyl-CoA synthase gamma subunit (corrinoid Fe-S protein)